MAEKINLWEICNQGDQSQVLDASLLAGEDMTLRPAPNMSKKPFFPEKMSGLRMLGEDCEST